MEAPETDGPEPEAKRIGEAAESEIKDRRCRYCREPIYALAVRCNDCGGYQNWRRFTDLGAVAVSLMIGLLGILTVVVPLLTEIIPGKSELILRSHLCERDGISLHIENRGSKPAVVGNFELIAYCKDFHFKPGEPRAPGGAGWGIYEILGADEKTSRTVPPRSTVQIRFLVRKDFLAHARDLFPDWNNKLKSGDSSRFYEKLNDSSIRVAFYVDLWNYGKDRPTRVKLTSEDGREYDEKGNRIGPDESFWRYYLTMGGYGEK